MRTIFLLLIALCSVASAEPIFQDRFEVDMTTNSLFVGHPEYLASIFPSYWSSHRRFFDTEGGGAFDETEIWAISFNGDSSLAALGLRTETTGEDDLLVFETRGHVDPNQWKLVYSESTGVGLVRGACFSPDGSQLAIILSASGFSLPGLKVYNTSDWSTDSSAPEYTGETFYGLDFHPNGSQLALAAPANEHVRVLDTSDWSAISVTDAVDASAWSVKYNNAGDRLAVGFDDSNELYHLTMYDTSDWSHDNSMTQPANVARSPDFSQDDSLLAVGYVTSPYLTVYNTSDWSTVSIPEAPTLAWGAKFLDDDNLLGVADGDETVYETTGWSKVYTSDISYNRGYSIDAADLGYPGNMMMSAFP